MRETARMLDDGSFFEVHVPLDENEEALNHMNHKEVDGASYISQKRYFLAEPVRDLISGKNVEGRCRVTQLVLTTMGGFLGRLCFSNPIQRQGTVYPTFWHNTHRRHQQTRHLIYPAWLEY